MRPALLVLVLHIYGNAQLLTISTTYQAEDVGLATSEHPQCRAWNLWWKTQRTNKGSMEGCPTGPAGYEHIALVIDGCALLLALDKSHTSISDNEYDAKNNFCALFLRNFAELYVWGAMRK
ncbi:hypothetical protein ANCCEY_02917 [Ancylostoma ceylanicum]|uniref:Secreted protein n=1 Tax=Ancylostoma ceylanicum TaxID=53326 RepID=A0A0D6M3D2_9BILA|nr:hypothetical protein ANCCEY_02917 [Ancylostoma ceylanicum]